MGYAAAGTLGIGTFMGSIVAGNDLLIRYTLYGDTNLDQIVEIGDFANLAANFNAPSSWARGNFNYDGLTDISDFSLLAANFNQSVPPPAPRVAPLFSTARIGEEIEL